MQTESTTATLTSSEGWMENQRSSTQRADPLITIGSTQSHTVNMTAMMMLINVPKPLQTAVGNRETLTVTTMEAIKKKKCFMIGISVSSTSLVKTSLAKALGTTTKDIIQRMKYKHHRAGLP